MFSEKASKLYQPVSFAVWFKARCDMSGTFKFPQTSAGARLASGGAISDVIYSPFNCGPTNERGCRIALKGDDISVLNVYISFEATAIDGVVLTICKKYWPPSGDNAQRQSSPMAIMLKDPISTCVEKGSKTLELPNSCSKCPSEIPRSNLHVVKFLVKRPVTAANMIGNVVTA